MNKIERLQIEKIYSLFREASTLSTDSREVKEGALFFALKGENFDGNIYANEALSKGAIAVVVDNPEVAKDSRYILVEDTLKALQQLASHHRDQFSIPVIAITGSNGKTTTKELISQLLSIKYRVLSTQGNLNNHIGVPLTLLSLDRESEVAVIEMGASAKGEISLLTSIAKPTIGIITNIGAAHLLGFENVDGVKEAKAELYSYIESVEGRVIYNSDDSTLSKLIEKYPKLKRVSYGAKESGATIEKTTLKNPYLTVNFREIGQGGKELIEEQISTKLIGEYNLPNILVALKVGELLKCNREEGIEAIEQYEPSNLRSQLIRGERNTIIVDSYNANPTSMRAALKNFNQIESDGKMAILGDMLELGVDSVEEHIKILKEAIESKYSPLLLVGQQFRLAGEKLQLVQADKQLSVKTEQEELHFFPEVTTLNKWLKEQQVEGHIILVKGSRGIALEKSLINLK